MLHRVQMFIAILVLTNPYSLSNDFEPILVGTVQIEGAFIRQNAIHVSMDSRGRIVFPGGNSVVAIDPMSGQYEILLTMEDQEQTQKLPNYDGRLRIQNAILNHTDHLYVIDYLYFFQMKADKQLNLLSCTVPYDGCINYWGPRTIAVDQNNEVYIVDGVNRDSEGIFKLNENERTLVIGGGEISLGYFEERRDQLPLSDIHFEWIKHFQVNQSEFTLMVPLGYSGELNGHYGDSFICKIDMQGNIRYYQNLLADDSTTSFILFDSNAILIYQHGGRDYSIYYHHIEQTEPKLLVEIEAQVLIREHGMVYDGQADNLYIVTYDYLNNELGESEGQYFVWKIPNIRSLISSSVKDWHDYQ